jgi:DNA mismatch repair protein MLH1
MKTTGATSISVTVREGGTKLLQVSDNGCGVAEADLPLLCARHATSKLGSYGELEAGRVGTYGFRGEALASMSYVAHVTVTTATAGAAHGWRATYRDGALAGPPAPCATPGHGTAVCLEDVFFNAPARRRGLAAAGEEYARCVDVVARYAVGRPGVGMSIRKQGATAQPDVVTPGGGGPGGGACGVGAGVGSAGASASSATAAVRCVYGPALAKALVPLAFASDGPAWEEEDAGGCGGPPPPPSHDTPAFRATGLISAPSHSGRRPVFILFINGRAVEAGLLRRSLEAAYAAMAPRGTRPWAFLDVRLPPSHVDVNVHPTNREVAFLHGDALAP